MKKLTAGIFATILGVTAMGAADAAVTSKGYVDAAVGAVAQSVTDLGTTVSNTYATKQALEGEVTARTNADNTLQGNVDTLAGKVGTPDEGKTVVEMIKAVEANAYDDTEVRGLITGNATAIQGLEANKADKSTTYTKTETDGLLNAKANSADLKPVATTGSYNSLTDLPTLGTAAAANIGDFATAAQGATADATAAKVATYGDIVTHNVAEFATAAQGELADTAVQPAAINDMATKTWVGEQNYVDETELAGKGYLTSANLTDYAKTADVVTNDEFTTFEASNTAAIADAKKAGTDAAAAAATADGKAVAAQGTADDALGKANTNAGAITNLEAFDNSIKTATEGSVDGTYTLTMKKTGDAMEFGWELIQRDGTLN